MTSRPQVKAMLVTLWWHPKDMGATINEMTIAAKSQRLKHLGTAAFAYLEQFTNTCFDAVEQNSRPLWNINSDPVN